MIFPRNLFCIGTDPFQLGCGAEFQKRLILKPHQFHLSGMQTAENVFHGSLRAMLQIIFQQMGGFNGPAVLR